MENSIKLKTCKKCKKSFPKTSEYFYKKGRRSQRILFHDYEKVYLMSTCKKCYLEPHKYKRFKKKGF
mgnify:CR=1 FL=1